MAGAFPFVAAANYGMTLIFDSITFNSWVGTTVLLARVASLLGGAGLSATILDCSSRVGTLSRVVAMLALIVTLGLLTSAMLANLGAAQPIEARLGLGTVILSLITYTRFGIEHRGYSI